MKKSILVLFIAIFIVPSIAFASWWNPFSWFKKKVVTAPQVQQVNTAQITSANDDAKAKIDELQKEISDLKNKQLNSNFSKTPSPKKDINVVIPTPVPVLAPPPAVAPIPSTDIPIVNNSPQRYFLGGKLDLARYNELTVLDYSNNHKASLDKPVKIVEGTIADFNQGTNNYISVIDNYDTSTSPTNVNFLVENDNDYTSITNQLTKWDNIIIYGYGVPNVDFNIVGNGGSYLMSKPVIIVDAIYKCPSRTKVCRYPYEMAVEKVFEKTK